MSVKEADYSGKVQAVVRRSIISRFSSYRTLERSSLRAHTHPYNYIIKAMLKIVRVDFVLNPAPRPSMPLTDKQFITYAAFLPFPCLLSSFMSEIFRNTNRTTVQNDIRNFPAT